MLQRVVITGLGTVNPLATNVEDTWDAIANGRSGIKPYYSNVRDIDISVAGTLAEDTLEYSLLSTHEKKQYDHFIHYGIFAAEQAVKDSGIDFSIIDPYKVGVMMSSGVGGLEFLDSNITKLRTRGARRVSPYLIPGMIINMLSGAISLRYGVKGLSYSVVSACSSSAHAIATAARHIQFGDADMIIVGGAEKAITDIGISGFSALRALSKSDDPLTASRPWDKDRDGFVMSDGSAALILESESHARKRGAHIYAECSGIGLSSDAYHIVKPDVSCQGARHCMTMALKSAGIELGEVDYINAHATSTRLGDPVEPVAVESIDKDAARRVAMSSTKSMHGHLLGATAALEALITIKSIEKNIVPPTINCIEPDFNTVINLVQNQAQERKVDLAMTNSFGFGGTNVSIVLRSYNE